MILTDQDKELAKVMAGFFADPLGFVMYSYPWDTDTSIQLARLQEPWASQFNCEFGPDVWACEFLDNLGRQIREHDFDGKQPAQPIREAIISGHGIGKSAMTGWLVNFIMSTRPYAQGTVTANTNTQLETKTWAQIAKWTRLCITSRWFDINTGRGSMKMVNKWYPEQWFCSGQTCRKENAEAFQGQHAANSTSFYIFDEASAIDDAIMTASEGGLTDGEPMQFAFGNPTQAGGWFRETVRRNAKRWHAVHVDSRTVQITNKAYLQGMVDDHGEDSDYVKIRVRGLFPAQSSKQFYNLEYLDRARGRNYNPAAYSFAPKILTCDPAWTGDDELVIGLRQGLVFQVLRTMPKNDNDMVVGQLLARLEDEHGADAVFIDLGYGTGIYSYGKTLGREWILVGFGEAAVSPGYVNKRAEMYGLAYEWLKEGGAFPDDEMMYHEAAQVQTVPRGDGKIQIESKEDLKRRKCKSPNRWDCLVLSFAHPVQTKNKLPGRQQAAKAREKYDPFRNLNARNKGGR